MPSNAKKRQREEHHAQHHPEGTNPNAKRKVCLLVAYTGAPYQGLQKNPGAVTVEETLEVAMHRAGAMTDDNVGTLQKISWSRAGRTDTFVDILEFKDAICHLPAYLEATASTPPSANEIQKLRSAFSREIASLKQQVIQLRNKVHCLEMLSYSPVTPEGES